MISKFILPQASVCLAIEKWLRSLSEPAYATAQVINVRVKSVPHGTFVAYVETKVKPKRGPPKVEFPARVADRGNNSEGL